ncbi:hypothetical protein FSOLCH5_008668 [Fusarium solani]
MSTTPPLANAGRSRKRRNSTPPGDERQVQKQRAQRTTLACERCRMKKLRCMGGHPCSSCQRAKSECDFGDRGWDSQHSISATNQRLSQLEKTIAELAAGLSHLTNSPGSIQPSARPTSYDAAGDQLFRDPSASVADARHPIPALERARNASYLGSPPLSEPQPIASSGPSFAVRSDISSLAPSHGIDVSPEPTRSPPGNPRMSERLESRWAALQHSSAPFPALMGHPTAWSGEPASTSPDDAAPQFTFGMTHYKAQVHLQSQPVSEGIVGEVAAREMFAL